MNLIGRGGAESSLQQYPYASPIETPGFQPATEESEVKKRPHSTLVELQSVETLKDISIAQP